ncbi:MAG TPA: hypothetical protein VJQ82_24050 [Terriglobales bacterium]|nr:hypothetical protein [Terriglobales bacterium]
MLSKVTRQRTWIPLSIALVFAFALNAAAQHRTGLAAFDSSHSVILQGTIQDVVSHPAPGTLLGEHLIVASTTGVHDVHIGPYVAKTAAGKSLHTNATVIVVGSPVTLAGKQVFLATHLVVNGQTIPVRNQNGFLIHPSGSRAQHSALKTAGGAQ